MPRSTLYEKRDRQTLQFRTVPSLRHKLEDAARSNGRTLSGEMEYRLARSFLADELDEAAKRVLARVNGPILTPPNMSADDLSEWRQLNS